MQEDLRGLLLAQPAIAALCGVRIYWGKRPQGGALPAIVLHVVSNVSSYAFSGTIGLDITRVQANIFGESYADVEGVTRALKTSISGVRAAYGATVFEGIFFDGRRDRPIAGVSDAGASFLISTDLLIHHKEN